MEAVEKINVSAIEDEANQAVRAEDGEKLGGVIATVEVQEKAFRQQAVEEDGLAQRAARELAAMKTKLAFLPEAEARQQHAELTFRVDYHGERARACQQQAETLGKLLGTLRG